MPWNAEADGFGCRDSRPPDPKVHHAHQSPRHDPSCFRRLPTDALFCSRCGSQVRRERKRETRPRELRHSLESAPPGSGGPFRSPRWSPSSGSWTGARRARYHAPPRSLVHGRLSPGDHRVEDGGEVTLADPPDTPRRSLVRARG